MEIRKMKLNLNKRLPQIHIEQKQIDLFLDWWNKDIRFEKTIPHSFEEGYLICDMDMKIDMSKFNTLIKQTARQFRTTYRDIENKFKNFIHALEHPIVYFKFLNDNTITMETFNQYDKSRISNISFQFGANSPDMEEEFTPQKMYEQVLQSEDFEKSMYCFNMLYVIILITSLWYIATTKRTTKYVYEQKRPVIASRHKNVVKVSDTKTINTPIYDITKIKTKKVDCLIKSRKGWTYSHSFQVHGHYRHYKDGRVIFINSYIKGKDKEFKPQVVELKPTK